MHHTQFAHQRHPFGAHHLVEEVHQGGLELGDFLALVAVQVGAWRGFQNRGVAEGGEGRA
ncbi:hypothetical protein D3C76_1427100 [compost metagenome]